MEKKEIYKWIKIAGILSYIPIILAAGPLAGYMIGEYIGKKFGISYYLTLIFIAIGFLGSIIEVIRILKFALKASDKS